MSQFVVFAGLTGLIVGSFSNVLIARLPEGESLVRPLSRCSVCGTNVVWRDNIPVVSWLLLRGRCRMCDSRISWQYPAVELACAAIWAAAAWSWGPSVRSLSAVLLASALLPIAITDARHYIIPDRLSIGGLVAGLTLAFLPGGQTPVSAVLGAAAGFGVLYVVGWLGEIIFHRPAMGGGDIKMLAMIGAFIGPVGALLTLFIGALLGAACFGPRALRTGQLVPFGVFLALGAALAFLFGDPILEWYFGLLSR